MDIQKILDKFGEKNINRLIIIGIIIGIIVGILINIGFLRFYILN